MAAKLVTLKNKNGDVYLPKTTVAQVIGLDDDLAAKQARLSQAQLDAVNSGITAKLVGKITAGESSIQGLGAVRFVQPGADLSGFSDSDLIIELNKDG